MENDKKTLENIVHDLKLLITLTNNTVGALTHYIAWKGDEPKFKKHLENLKKDDKLKENDKKDEKNKD
jgi:hypothetical protein|tara:strand:+ start:289 stop:492 length:204 start_codon:yes stop_codon:yes gene_type:complete